MAYFETTENQLFQQLTESNLIRSKRYSPPLLYYLLDGSLMNLKKKTFIIS